MGISNIEKGFSRCLILSLVNSRVRKQTFSNIKRIEASAHLLLEARKLDHQKIGQAIS